jgi:UDP-N-acetylglucosamine:LPS N-acetylglucosamine transferase
MKKKKLVIFTTSEGHWSLSEAFRTKLSETYDIEIFFDRPKITDIYSVVYQVFPALYRIPFSVTKDERMLKVLLWSCLRHYRKRIAAYIKKEKPDICLCVYSAYLPALANVQQKTGIVLYNFVTEPRSVHPSYVHAGVNNLVFDQRTETLCHNFGQFSSNIVGWPVRPDFEERYVKDKVREKLHLEPKVFTILIVSGSLGTNTIYSLLPAFLRTKKHIQVVVCCGKNRTLFRAMNVFKNVLTRVTKKCDFTVIGFTKQLHKYMQAADLVVGKAGPQTVFESIATETPFLAITHIAGLEDGMLDIIREYNVGYVEENPIKAMRLISKLINNSKPLEEMKVPLKTLAAYNRKCGQRTQEVFAQHHAS